MNYQLLDDKYYHPYQRLTPQKRKIIQGIKRPQLKEDVYLAITGRSTSLPVRIKKRLEDII